MTVDPYLDPDSWVLRNKLGISDRLVLRQAEDDLAGARMAVIAEDASLPAEYGWPLLSAIHALLFADVYEWAGTLRTVGISKDAESQFTPPESLTAELEAFEALLADTLTNSAEKISSGTSPSCTGRSTTSTPSARGTAGPSGSSGSSSASSTATSCGGTSSRSPRTMLRAGQATTGTSSPSGRCSRGS